MMDTVFDSVTTQSTTFVLGIITGFFVYFICNRCTSSKDEKKEKAEGDENEYVFTETDSKTKMIIVIRNDLKMGKGKAAAQCAHGAVIATEIAAKKRPDILQNWKNSGQRKIVVKTESEAELLNLASEARTAGLIHAIVRDAGLTQILSGTKTVLAIGPGPEKLIDQVTNHLKLY